MSVNGGGPSVHRAALVVTVNACMFVFGVVLLLMGSILPGLQVSSARAGTLGSFPLLGILAATLFIGPVLDKSGAKLALALSLALIAAALVLMPALSGYAALAGAALVYGLGGGVLNTAANALVASLNAAGRGAALNVLGFSFSLGAVAAPLLMSLAISRVSISMALRLLAVAPAVVLIAVIVLRFPPPVRSGTPLRSLLRVLNQPLVWLIGLLLFFESGSENCTFVWAGEMMKDALHVEAGRAALALVGVSVALGAGRLLAALWFEWLGSRNVLLLSASLIIAGVIVTHAGRTFGTMAAGFAVIGLGMSAVFPTALGILGDRFPGETGTVFGAVMTLALVGGSSGPLAGGWLAGRSPTGALAVPFAAAVAIAIITVTIAGRRTAMAPEAPAEPPR
jgi:MFS transporter, FHS family, glucose/mannose:H+ symporter